MNTQPTGFVAAASIVATPMIEPAAPTKANALFHAFLQKYRTVDHAP